MSQLDTSELNLVAPLNMLSKAVTPDTSHDELGVGVTVVVVVLDWFPKFVGGSKQKSKNKLD